MSVSPERPAESLSLGLQAAHGANAAPLLQEGSATEKTKRRNARKQSRRHRNLESPASRWSGDAIQELLRFRLHVEANVLVRLIAGNGSNALYEIEDALRRPTFFNQHRIDDLARLGFRE